MYKSFILFLALLLSSISVPSFASAESTTTSNIWHYTNAQGELKVKLYFFWSKTCPHCAEAHPFIDSLPERYPWIEVEDHMITAPETMEVWQQVAKQTGTDARSVPYFASGEKAVVGYTSQAVTGEFLLQRLKAYYVSLGGTLAAEVAAEYPAATTAAGGLFATCSETDSKDGAEGTCDLGLSATSEVSSSDVQPVELPLVGVVHPEQMSLPLLTVVLAGVDAFNPCIAIPAINYG